MNVRNMVARVLEQKRPVRFLLSRLLAKSGLSEQLGMKIRRPGYFLYFFNSSVSMHLWLSSGERSEDIRIISSVLRPGDIYVDVGANIGDLALAGALAVGATGRVYAFEAHPKIFNLFSRNVRLNGVTNIYRVNAACGEDFGWVRFGDKSADDMNQVGEGDLVVPLIPAKALIPDEPIGLLKIDVEGFELFVLRGIGPALAETRVLLLEVGDGHFQQFGYNFADIFDMLTQYRFLLFRKDGANSWAKVTDRMHPFPVVQNILAVRDAGDLPDVG